MEVHFKKIVQTIFSNWTGLQMAVDHSFAGPNSKYIATQFVDYMVNYLINDSEVEIEDIIDVIEDTMDQEFNTVFEDNSVPEVASLLYKFLKLLREGNLAQCEIEYCNLPPAKNWLTQPVAPQNHSQIVENDSSSDSNVEEQMEGEDEDPGWTTVRSNRRRR